MLLVSIEAAMKLERDAQGDFFIEPRLLALRFSLRPDDLRRRMRLGQVISRVEDGQGSDSGHRRVWLRCDNMVWRAVLDADHRVIAEETIRLK
jgi:hypothetical protein